MVFGFIFSYNRKLAWANKHNFFRMRDVHGTCPGPIWPSDDGIITGERRLVTLLAGTFGSRLWRREPSHSLLALISVDRC